jgi:hypothetical protein
VEITSIDNPLDWNITILSHQDNSKNLIKGHNDWEYEGYGQIKSLNPVVVDFGDIQLETGEWTDDETLVGEFVYWKIDRLDIMRKENCI